MDFVVNAVRGAADAFRMRVRLDRVEAEAVRVCAGGELRFRLPDGLDGWSVLAVPACSARLSTHSGSALGGCFVSGRFWRGFVSSKRAAAPASPLTLCEEVCAQIQATLEPILDAYRVLCDPNGPI